VTNIDSDLEKRQRRVQAIVERCRGRQSSIAKIQSHLAEPVQMSFCCLDENLCVVSDKMEIEHFPFSLFTMGTYDDASS